MIPSKGFLLALGRLPGSMPTALGQDVPSTEHDEGQEPEDLSSSCRPTTRCRPTRRSRGAFSMEENDRNTDRPRCGGTQSDRRRMREMAQPIESSGINQSLRASSLFRSLFPPLIFFDESPSLYVRLLSARIRQSTEDHRIVPQLQAAGTGRGRALL